jgi:hypothetical protein
MFANELTKYLIEQKDERRESARKKLHFLHHVGTKKEKKSTNVFGCRYISVFTNPTKCSLEPEAVLHFGTCKPRLKPENFTHLGGNIRLFLRKDVTPQEIFKKIENAFSVSEKEAIRILREKLFGIGYLSSYEARKLIPEKGDRVSRGLKQLEKAGLLTKHHDDSARTRALLKTCFGRSRPLDFYTTVEEDSAFEAQREKAVLDEVIEFWILSRALQLVIRDTDTTRIIRSFRGTIRPKNPDLLRQVNGMSFDMVLPLRTPIGDWQVFGIDVYTRFSVTNDVIERFARKIEQSPKCYGHIFTRRDLNDEKIQNSTGKNFEIVFLEKIRGSRYYKNGIFYGDIREKVLKKQDKIDRAFDLKQQRKKSLNEKT